MMGLKYRVKFYSLDIVKARHYANRLYDASFLKAYTSNIYIYQLIISNSTKRFQVNSLAKNFWTDVRTGDYMQPFPLA